jgi:hypothetical protein
LQQQQHRRQQQQQQARLQRPSPPAQPRTQVEAQYCHGASSSPQHLPASYPVSRTERLQQLAQPKAMQRQKYDQVRLGSGGLGASVLCSCVCGLL